MFLYTYLYIFLYWYKIHLETYTEKPLKGYIQNRHMHQKEFLYLWVKKFEGIFVLFHFLQVTQIIFNGNWNTAVFWNISCGTQKLYWNPSVTAHSVFSLGEINPLGTQLLHSPTGNLDESDHTLCRILTRNKLTHTQKLITIQLMLVILVYL